MDSTTVAATTLNVTLEDIVTTTQAALRTTTAQIQQRQEEALPKVITPNRVSDLYWVVVDKPNLITALACIAAFLILFFVVQIVFEVYQTLNLVSTRKKWTPQQTILHDDTVFMQMREQIPGKRNNWTTNRKSKRSLRSLG